MGKRVSAHVEARIATLHRERRTEAQIATTLRREGVEITPSGVHRVLSRLGHAAPRKAPKGSSRPAAAPVAAVAPQAERADESGPDDLQERLRRTLASLERVALQAEADKDVGRVVAAQRAITQATALLAKATPPPPVDVDARPDMVAAAKRGRERILALAARILGGAS